MNKDNDIDVLIEQAFLAHPWRGIIPINEAIADAIRYRQALCQEDREVYDQQIRAGGHPSKAMDTVEIVSGRDQPHSINSMQEPITANVR